MLKRLLPCLFALLLLLTGCGSNDLPEETDPHWEQFQQGAQPEEIHPNAPELPEAFSLAYHKDHTLDPISCGEGLQQDVSDLLYEPLFELDNSFSPTPVLCESYSWDESGLVCTLNMREGILFSDGTELSAADAAASLRRAMTSEKYGYRLRQVVSATSNRSGQVIVTLSVPNSGFVSLLDIPIVKRGTENQMVPIGTGPYLFVTGSEGSFLQANDEWWQQKPLPVSTISLVHAKDVDTAIHLFSSRRVELISIDPTGDQLSASGQIRETDRPTTTMQFIGFNTRSGIFIDSALRSLFSQGLQRDMIVNAFLSDHALASSFPISPLSDLYPAELTQTSSYEKLLSALTYAGQNSGTKKELTLLVNSEDPFRMAIASFVAEDMSLLDWSISINALPWAEYKAALADGQFDLYLGEIRLTADWDLSDLVGSGGALNYGGYSDPYADALLTSFSAAGDRQIAARNLCAHLQLTAPIAPICFRNHTVLTHPDVVDGLAPSSSNTFFGIHQLQIHLDN